MSSPSIGDQRKILRNRTCSPSTSLPQCVESPPRHQRYREADRTAPSISNSPTLSSAPPFSKLPVPCTRTMSHANSSVPSGKLPFSSSVTGNGAVLIGTLASFDSEAARFRQFCASERGVASDSSSGLSHAAVLLSGRGDASPPFAPQPSDSVLAVFCPLTSKAWQSGTLRDGMVADADTTSKATTKSPKTCLQSPLLFSSGWSQQSVSSAEDDMLPSVVGTPGRPFISTGAESDDAKGTAHSCGAVYSPHRPVSLQSASKSFTPVQTVKSPEPVVTKFTSSPVSRVSFTTPPSLRAPRTGAARGAGATPALSSCLPSESLEQHSLLQSPVLNPLTPLTIFPSASLSPQFGSTMATEQTQSRLSHHRLTASAVSEELPKKASKEMRSRGPTDTLSHSAYVPSLNSDHDTLEGPIMSLVQRSYHHPLPSSNEASLSSFFAAQDPWLHATLSMAQVGDEDAEEQAASTTLPRVCSSEATQAEDGNTAARGADTTDNPFEAFWDLSPRAGWDNSATELQPHIITSSTPLETASAFRTVTAFAPETHEDNCQISEEESRSNRLSCFYMGRHRIAAGHRASEVQQRNSVNTSVDTQRAASKATTLQQRQRRFSLPQDGTIEIKRRSCT
ncbi:hypothetical protein LtaPh_3402100 [Leishmania tarentolae]|uniref:Uncharacterized protein n=1 Tax=Leishmania tarentolae TaxID=5689 RepID=A0A640KR49_LEITA|nr:hypothetical protein LtaPh_3402100 [Leishmania tarentolae]